MKILMLTPYLPYPPSSGGQVRSYNLIKKLAQKHQITLFSLIKEEEEKKYISELEKFCGEVSVFKRPEKPWDLKNILRTGFGLYPFLVVRNLSHQEKEAVALKLQKENFDLIHAETFYVMPHIPQTTIPVLLVEQTIEFQVYQHFADTFKFWPLKPLFYIDVAKLKFWETRFWQKAAKVIAVSEADKTKMLSLVPALNVTIVPNGAGEDLVALWGKRKVDFKKPIVLYQGNFSWLQNVEAATILAKEVFPIIKRQIPSARCWIVGQGVKTKIGNLKGEGIEVHDLETSDTEGVRRAYQEATVFLAPLLGPGGTRLKILGAMAAGVPVVTTKIGIEGIEAKDSEEVFISESWSEMAKTTVKLIQDQNLYEQVIRAARKLIVEKYSWDKIADGLDKIYMEVGSGKKS